MPLLTDHCDFNDYDREQLQEEPLDLSCKRSTSTYVPFETTSTSDFGNSTHQGLDSTQTPKDNDNLPELISSNSAGMCPTNEPCTPVNRKLNKRKMNKVLKQSGKTHYNYNGEICPQKEFTFHDCKCNFNCKSLTTEERKNIFEHFWKLGSWDSQTTFICSTTKQVENIYI